MSVSCAALMCHAPIVIPKIAGERAAECARTTAAMREVARRLVAHEPEVLVLISPHTPREPRRFGLVRAAWLEGDFGRFGVPQVALRMRGAPDAAAAVAEAAELRGLGTWSPSGSGLDHGALVPMFFLAEAGYTGKVLLIALPHPDTGLEATMGHAIADAARTLGQRFVVEKLGAEVPLHFSGYHPDFRLDAPATPTATLIRARAQALAAGLHHVYTGNVHDVRGQSTYCAGCGERLIERDGYTIGEYRVRGGACPKCKKTLAGRFDDQPGRWGNRRMRLPIHSGNESIRKP